MNLSAAKKQLKKQTSQWTVFWLAQVQTRTSSSCLYCTRPNESSLNCYCCYFVLFVFIFCGVWAVWSVEWNALFCVFLRLITAGDMSSGGGGGGGWACVRLSDWLVKYCWVEGVGVFAVILAFSPMHQPEFRCRCERLRRPPAQVQKTSEI